MGGTEVVEDAVAAAAAAAATAAAAAAAVEHRDVFPDLCLKIDPMDPPI